MGGEGLWEGHQEFGFGHAESLTLTWFLNKVSRLDEVIKSEDRQKRELRPLPPALKDDRDGESVKETRKG